MRNTALVAVTDAGLRAAPGPIHGSAGDDGGRRLASVGPGFRRLVAVRLIIDAIRAGKIALDRGIGGPLVSASSYLMKSPPVQRPDDEGRARLKAFIAGDEER